MIEFLTASHNDEILENNLLKSPIFKHRKLTVQRGYDNIPRAYNAHKPTSGIIVYLHHDVYLPEKFEDSLLASLFQLPDAWGCLGVAGVLLDKGVKKEYGHIQDRGFTWGNPSFLPQPVQTLDELLIVTRGDIVFDENLPQDFYAADACMQSTMRGKKNYAIKAFCHHNSSRAVGGRTESFYESEKYFANKWKNSLPIVTTCSFLK